MSDPILNLPGAAVSYTQSFPTGRLRWLVPAHTSTEPPRLQQEWAVDWQNELGGGRVTEWHDVPLVIGDA